jgi:hypothetical protein
LAPFYLQTHLELNQIYLKYTGRKFHKHSKGLNLIKIGLKIKIQNFGCWSHFDPLYILETVRAIVSILYKENFIMNIKKKTSLRLVETLTLHIQKKRRKKYFFTLLGLLSLFLLFISDEQKKIKNLINIPARFDSNWPIGFREED